MLLKWLNPEERRNIQTKSNRLYLQKNACKGKKKLSYISTKLIKWTMDSTVCRGVLIYAIYSLYIIIVQV